ncbi:MAG TPA: hypothetical protein DCO72_08715 [Ruminococcus sp.]|nr:hypothetical protein [Ruminococcus sp.]
MQYYKFSCFLGRNSTENDICKRIFLIFLPICLPTFFEPIHDFKICLTFQNGHAIIITRKTIRGENMMYPFRRSFFYDVQKAIERTAVTFILGARKCGKTVCMNQLADDYQTSELFDNVYYVDVKNDCPRLKDKISLKKRIINDIDNNRKVLYLIDEATYLDAPDVTIGQIRNAYSRQGGRNTRIVFAGSQSRALEYWGKSEFSGFSSFVNPTFLSYAEWLTWKGFTEISEETYFQFIRGTREFYCDFVSIKDYLYGCLDETVKSNNNAENFVPENDCSGLTDDMLLDVLYATLFSLHNSGTYFSFSKPDSLSRKLITYFSELFSISEDLIEAYAKDILKERYANLKSMTSYDLKKALHFLDSCGLITITPQVSNINEPLHLDGKIAIPETGKITKEEIFARNNICIAYPMFYVDIMEQILGNTLTDAMPHKILGSIVECHVRGLLPNVKCVEYRANDNTEIDYIHLSLYTAIEITISDKKPKNVHFDVLPDNSEYRKILLTKTKSDVSNGIERVPYYQFIYDNSDGSPIRQQLKHKTIITPNRR